MCGIAGIVHLSREAIPDLDRKLGAMNTLQKHRGPDDEGTYSVIRPCTETKRSRTVACLFSRDTFC